MRNRSWSLEDVFESVMVGISAMGCLGGLAFLSLILVSACALMGLGGLWVAEKAGAVQPINIQPPTIPPEVRDAFLNTFRLPTLDELSFAAIAVVLLIAIAIIAYGKLVDRASSK